jgi:hypothetical protein
LKLFRKEKLLNDNEFYHWVRNYQCGEDDDDDDDDDDGERVVSAVSCAGILEREILFFCVEGSLEIDGENSDDPMVE